MAVNGESYNKLRLDKGKDWIVIYLPYSHTQINLVIDEGGAENLKWLYFLLIIPVAGGALIFIYRNKIFNKIKKEKASATKAKTKTKPKPKTRATTKTKSKPKPKKPKNKAPQRAKRPKTRKRKNKANILQKI